MDLRNPLIQLLWDPRYKERPHTFEISYIHRGVPSGEKSIFLSEVSRIDGKFLIISEGEGEEAHIPLHRVTRVFDLELDQAIYMHQIPHDTPHETA